MNNLEFSVLSSGSRANALYVRFGETAFLVDCGLSLRELTKRMLGQNLSLESIKGIVITHEHSDHVYGVANLAKKLGVPIWITAKTLKAWKDAPLIPVRQIEIFSAGGGFSIGRVEITTFSTPHDAVDPVGLRIITANGNLGVCTDLGHIPAAVRESLKGLDAVILESNHDPELLKVCPYPSELKKRIASRWGHLSNITAAAFFEELLCEVGSRLNMLVAAHISEKSNHPSLVTETLSEVIGLKSSGVQLMIASAKEALPIYKIGLNPISAVSAYDVEPPIAISAESISQNILFT